MNNRKLFCNVLLVYVTLILCPHTFSEELSNGGRPELEDLVGRIDLSVPESPAFTVLGVTPENVMRPTSGRALATGILNGLDARGNFQAGLAVDTRPYLLSQGADLTLDDYRSNKLKRNLARVRLSLATAKGLSDSDKSDRFSIGVHWTPWDEGDKRMDFNPNKLEDPETLEGCYRKMLSFQEENEPDTLPIGGDAVAVAKWKEQLAAQDEVLKKKAKECVKKAEERNWNASAWDIGAAAYSANAKGDDKDGYALWTSLALRLGENGQFLANARYQNNQLVPDDKLDDTYITQNEAIIGGRVRWGNSKSALMLEGSYIDTDPEGGDDDSSYRVSIGTEFRLIENLWLQAAIGDTFDSDRDDEDTFLSGQLRWALSEQRLLR